MTDQLTAETAAPHMVTAYNLQGEVIYIGCFEFGTDAMKKFIKLRSDMRVYRVEHEMWMGEGYSVVDLYNIRGIK